MKKILILPLLAAVLSLSGCFINITATTKINDDGSGFRITTYTADGAAEKEEVLKNYGLPSGGEWRLNQYVKDAAPQHVYEVKRTFKDLNSLKPDYVRRGAKAGDTSANKFSLKIKNGILFTTYEYEETFRDCTDEGKIRRFCKDWYDHCLEIAADEVATAFPKIAKKGKIKALLDERYRPYFDYFLASFISEGRSVFGEKNTQFQMKMAEYGQKYSAENFSEFLADHIVSLDKNTDRKTTVEKLKETHAKIDKEFSDYSTALNGSNYDDAFGAYGWPIFMGYSFDMSVVMPGRIIEANTGTIRSNVAKWEFTNDDFLLKEFKLQAKSRRLNFVGIGVMALILIAVLIVTYKRERKNK